ncbi:hypothetical protein EPNKCIFM_00026 [Klebsiella phage KP13-16]|nr:hypothetical protein EPNKCIFM_00026 [Klebsiella phage KP13-16]
MQTFFEIYAALLFSFLFCLWSTKGYFNWFIKIALFIGVVSGIIINYQNLA